ncbi:MAG: hypothetical protein QM692_01755 [Thermomicrobiales bacterium]
MPEDTELGETGRPVAIVGMHRSGTSMVAKLLAERGLYLGPEHELMPPAPQNPEGFFEHLAFVQLNDEILNEAGAGWDCPPPESTNWGGSGFSGHLEQARTLAAPLAAEGPWGWKDPRTSLTLPFWRAALGPLRTVLVVRNPLEVITSLHRRNGFSLALSLTLWQIYAERVLADTTPANRIVTHFDAWFVDAAAEAGRIAAALGLPGIPDAETSTTANVGLRHHRKSIDDLRAAGIPERTFETYRALCAEAGWFEGSDDEGVAAYPAGATHTAIATGLGRVNLLQVENETLRRNIADFTTAIEGRDARVSELEGALGIHEATRSELEAFLRERDGRLRERNAVLQIRDADLATQRLQAAEQQEKIEWLRAQLDQASDRVAELERNLEIGRLHEQQLRQTTTALQQVQFHRDADIMGTLGSVLSRYAPGAPASIYHRKLIAQIRDLVAANIPTGSRVLVVTNGDPAMLHLGELAAEDYPSHASAISADYTDVSDDAAIAQLGELQMAGATFLVIPSPALPWMANHPALEQHLADHHELVMRERGILSIYALRQ